MNNPQSTGAVQALRSGSTRQAPQAAGALHAFQSPAPPTVLPIAPVAPLERLLMRNLHAHRALFAQLDALADDICAAGAAMAAALANGGRLYFFGNGGSASDSQHLAAELSGRLRQERGPLAAMALTADSAAMTAIANDYGYEQVFARQIGAYGRPGDCAVGISTSGDSPNVLRALDAARDAGMTCIGLLGRSGGAALALTDHAVVVPAQDSARIQEAHIFIGHTWCGQIEQALGLVPPG